MAKLSAWWLNARPCVLEMLNSHEDELCTVQEEVDQLRKQLKDLRAEYDGHIDEHMQSL